MTTLDFHKFKSENRKISMVTCYDSTFARIINDSDIDCILIGDSASMVMHGEKTTVPAKMEWMEEHTRSVRNGAPDKYIVADMPFLTTRKGLEHATDCAGRLLVAGANSVKIEGIFGQEEIIAHIVQSGIPVMAHLGLTPQFYNAFGGHKMQGRTEEAAEKIIEEAKLAEKLGCYAIVLECIPAALAAKITKAVSIPTIGIGAGVECDGQVLVLFDMLGMTGFKIRFVRQYLNGLELIKGALNQYSADVHSGDFPKGEEIK
ncbi:3-methyl-2-oxobutanoate hydroxymethyltransferase [uncultured Treponema sp.]|uniref:3-methyl-2-oxobutanoate hydroxymethyltransferase n=1 Tax=uncultured Treponema sp. TaxID=162155 RepID=UPI0025EE2F17|nr:3-methyl-2-oxobutanoate hydroxymethyltransferase [uncultured Treponema sp.]